MGGSKPRGRSTQELEAALRRHSPPILARVERDQLVLDLRTVFDDQDEVIAQAFESMTNAGQ